MTNFIKRMAGVTRVEKGNSSTVVPAYNARWPERKRIAWKLAVVYMDHGLEVEVYDSNSRTKRFGVWIDNYPREYGVAGLDTSCTTGPFSETWVALNAMGFGYSIAKREIGSEK